MKNIQYWFGWFILMLPIHLTEQWFFGIQELNEMRHFSDVFHSWFHDPDYGTVALVGIIVLLVVLMIYAVLIGGRWRLLVFGVFGLVGVGESHHIIKTIAHMHYISGAVTAIPFVAVGLLLLRAVIREWRRHQQAPSS